MPLTGPDEVRELYHFISLLGERLKFVCLAFALSFRLSEGSCCPKSSYAYIPS
jgi:hypothetical protein